MIDEVEFKVKRISPARTFDYKKVKHFIDVESNSGCELLTQNSPDLRANTNLQIKCKCGIVFSSSYSRFINKLKPKRQCNECGQNMKINTYAKVLDYIVSNSNCTLLDSEEDMPFIKATDTLHLKCECGELINTTFNKFRNSRRKGCIKCSKHYTKTYEEIKLYVETESNGNCKIISKNIKGTRNKFMLKCICGKSFESTIDSIYRHKKFCCNECSDIVRAKKLRLSYEELKNRINSSNGCELISSYNDYTNNSSVLEIKCLCGRLFVTSLKSFEDEIRPKNKCDYCANSISKGEETIERYLLDRSYSFEREYAINDCRNKNPLPFDFGIHNKEGLLCLIEFDGEQHYHPIEHWGGDIGFDYRKKNDNIKDEYCRLNDIQLIRVPYFIKDIEGFLDLELQEVKNNVSNL